MATIIICKKLDSQKGKQKNIERKVCLRKGSVTDILPISFSSSIKLSPPGADDSLEKKQTPVKIYSKEIWNSPTPTTQKQDFKQQNYNSPPSAAKIKIFNPLGFRDNALSLTSTKTNNWVAKPFNDPPPNVSLETPSIFSSFNSAKTLGGSPEPGNRSKRIIGFVRGLLLLYSLKNIILSIKITHPYFAIYFLYNPFISRVIRALLHLLRLQSFFYLTSLLLPTLV